MAYTPLGRDGAAACRAAQLESTGAVHVPASQRAPLVQAVLQAPQWVALVRVSVSQPLVALPSQLPKPVSQAATPHAPAAHSWPVAQAFPHAPQWVVSLARVTHEPPHTLCPLGQLSRHMPSAQSSPAPQARPQAPQ